MRLALRVENGAGVPLQVRAGQTFYVDQIDLHASLNTNVDEGVVGLSQSGDFAGLDWSGTAGTDTDFADMPNPDGTWSRRRYYRGATWMEKESKLTLQQLDASGSKVGPPIQLHLGKDDQLQNSNTFFLRRFHAIQWTNDCAFPGGCTGAQSFTEEALVEARYAGDHSTPFSINPATASLSLTWSARPGPGWIIPVTQVASPAFDYGFAINLSVITPPGPDGSYPPGSDITFQATLTDGSGTPLFPSGMLPSFFEAQILGDPTGIKYYNGFFDAGVLYYRRKHMEGMMMAELVGPVQSVTPIHNIVSIDTLVGDEVAEAASPSSDGFLGQVVTFPRGPQLFGGAFDPEHAGWFEPVSNTWTHHIDANAAPGTYLMTMKARRAYLGEDLPVTSTISVQVGSPKPTSPVPTVGKCGSCHVDSGALSNINHDDPNINTCVTCHAPIAIELNNQGYVRAHFVHSRSDRFPAPLDQCSQCHLSNDGIQRTSKSACLSCHTSYPADHVQNYGPITDPFIGGGAADSFSQCSTTCHTTHPNSGLNGGHGQCR